MGCTIKTRGKNKGKNRVKIADSILLKLLADGMAATTIARLKKVSNKTVHTRIKRLLAQGAVFPRNPGHKPLFYNVNPSFYPSTVGEERKPFKRSVRGHQLRIKFKLLKKPRDFPFTLDKVVPLRNAPQSVSMFGDNEVRMTTKNFIVMVKDVRTRERADAHAGASNIAQATLRAWKIMDHFRRKYDLEVDDQPVVSRGMHLEIQGDPAARALHAQGARVSKVDAKASGREWWTEDSEKTGGDLEFADPSRVDTYLSMGDSIQDLIQGSHALEARLARLEEVAIVNAQLLKEMVGTRGASGPDDSGEGFAYG